MLLHRGLHATRTIRAPSSSAIVAAQHAVHEVDEYPFASPPPPITSYPHSHPSSHPDPISFDPFSSSRPQRAPPSIDPAFEPRESDFSHDDADADPLPSDLTYPPSALDPPHLPTYEASLKKPRRRRRAATAVPDLPPLPPTASGLSRFDWRASAPLPSRRGERWWFPETWRARVNPPMRPLTELDGYWPEIRRYTEHFVPLLEAEQAEAERQFNERLKEWPAEQLAREGFMLSDIGASTEWQPKFRVEGRVVTFAKTGAAATRPLPMHQFQPGSTVLLSRRDPLGDPVLDESGTALKGNVLSAARGFIRVAFPFIPPDIDIGHWRIDVGCSDFAFRRQKEAIVRLNLDPVAQDMADFAHAPLPASNSVEDEALHAARKPRDQQVLTGTALRDLLLRRFQAEYEPAASGVEDNFADAAEMKPSDVDAVASPTAHIAGPAGILHQNQLIASWAQRYRSPRAPVVVEGDPAVPLNASQVRAIALMLSERLSLVQGPPGTGKTRVIVETIKLLKKHWRIPHPILVCAHTNVAVDNLLDGLNAHGVRALRFGNAARVPESLLDLTFDAKLEEHPLWKTMEALKDERTRLQEGLTGKKGDAAQKRIGAINSRLFLLRRRVHYEVLANADVICTTCLSATSRMLDVIDFPFVFLDEASMATEPLSLVPLTKGAAQVAIIGDHKQLPPVILSEDAQAGGLATSMFERLIHEKHIPSIMLDTQYRMHPSISSFSSRTFYNSALKDGTVAPDGSVRPGLEPPATAFLRDGPEGRLNVTFLNHDFPESPAHRSIANYHEAGRVCDIVADLLHNNPDLKGADIGVIAPYIAQIRTISDFLKADPERQAAFRTWLGDRADEVHDIEVKTVDGFEGREKAVILFSTVRSNPGGYIGFLADWRRLNVGLTRARRALIMLGSARTLADARVGQYASDALPRDGGRVWRAFVAWLRDRGMIMEDD